MSGSIRYLQIPDSGLCEDSRHEAGRFHPCDRKAPGYKTIPVYFIFNEEQYRKKAIEVLQSDTKLSEVLQA